MGADRDVDLVFVIDDGPTMAGWQAQLASQLSAMMEVLQNLPEPLGLHVGVVSSDLGIGRAANVAIPGCSAGGDAGNLRSQPEGMCTDSTLAPGATFISDIGDSPNYSAADDASEPGIAKVFQCVADLGTGGCGFGQPLAALVRALGADGQPPPAANAGFLRPDAYLAIVIISNEDDCSVPSDSSLFSLRDLAENDLGDPRGPLTHYRCNHAGHLCQDANGNLGSPPLSPPADATAGVPSLALADCVSNEDGALTPVSKLVAEIKALKADPQRILVSAVAGPATPYTVEWVPEVGGTKAGELWPQVAPSCGSEAADGGAFGEPGVRISQFVNAFSDSVLASVCDSNWATALQIFSRRLPVDTFPPCFPDNIATRTDGQGRTYPDCAVTERLTTTEGTQEIQLAACAVAPPGAPCWSLGAPADAADSCVINGKQSMTITNEPVGPDPASYTATVSVSCQIALPADAGTCPGGG